MEGTKTYCCYNKYATIREKSSSGGLFYLIAKYVIANKGVVFGARYDDSFNVVHGYSDTLVGIKEFMGSKYVQSDMRDTFSEVKEYLSSDRMVLFSGTPCQINGLIKFLGKKYENLIAVDFICHGVPSPLVWEKYLKYVKGDRKINDIAFRDKENGWREFALKIDFSDGKNIYEAHTENLYFGGFLGNLYLRPSCYNCNSKGENRASDITIADFWGVEKEVPEMYDNKGATAIIVNSERGEKVFEKIKKEIEYREVQREQVINHNPSWLNSVEKNKYRNKFFYKFLKTNYNFKYVFFYVNGGSIGIVKKILLRPIKNFLQKLRYRDKS